MSNGTLSTAHALPVRAAEDFYYSLWNDEDDLAADLFPMLPEAELSCDEPSGGWWDTLGGDRKDKTLDTRELGRLPDAMNGPTLHSRAMFQDVSRMYLHSPGSRSASPDWDTSTTVDSSEGSQSPSNPFFGPFSPCSYSPLAVPRKDGSKSTDIARDLAILIKSSPPSSTSLPVLRLGAHRTPTTTVGFTIVKRESSGRSRSPLGRSRLAVGLESPPLSLRRRASEGYAF